MRRPPWFGAGGRVSPFDGDLEDCQRIVLSDRGHSSASRQQNDSAPTRINRTEMRRAAAEKRVELAPVRRRIADAEAAVKRLTQEIARTDAALAAPDLFARDPAKAAILAKTRADAANALTRAEDEWLAASAEFEIVMT